MMGMDNHQKMVASKTVKVSPVGIGFIPPALTDIINAAPTKPPTLRNGIVKKISPFKKGD